MSSPRRPILNCSTAASSSIIVHPFLCRAGLVSPAALYNAATLARWRYWAHPLNGRFLMLLGCRFDRGYASYGEHPLLGTSVNKGKKKGRGMVAARPRQLYGQKSAWSLWAQTSP